MRPSLHARGFAQTGDFGAVQGACATLEEMVVERDAPGPRDGEPQEEGEAYHLFEAEKRLAPSRLPPTART